jgi:hypothetical protein
MKKSLHFPSILSLFTLLVGLLLTNEIAAQKSIVHAKKTVKSEYKDIEFNILSANCYSGGSSYTVQIDSLEKYAFLWEVNGSHGGHEIDIDCACGRYATVRIMGLSDGLQTYSTINLEKCNFSIF